MDLSIQGAHLLNMMRSWDRHSSKSTISTPQAPQLNYEFLAIDLVDQDEINKISEHVQELMFGKFKGTRREVTFDIHSYNGFSVLYLPLHGEYLRKGDGPLALGEYSRAMDQIVFACLMIKELQDHIVNVPDVHKLHRKEDKQ